jgi:hypothetical protein
MSLTVSAGSGDFQIPPAGNHLARCYRIIDLGTQKTTWKGVEKAMKKVMITWELHGEDEQGGPLMTDDGKPLIISKRFTPSLGPKATLRAFLVSWRGKQFTDDELLGFKLENIIDKWCMISISHETKDGKTFANVSSVSAVPLALKKAGLPDGVNPALMFDIDDPDMEVYESLTDYLKELIAKSPEWQMRSGQHSLPKVDLDDDIPF